MTVNLVSGFLSMDACKWLKSRTSQDIKLKLSGTLLIYSALVEIYEARHVLNDMLLVPPKKLRVGNIYGVIAFKLISHFPKRSASIQCIKSKQQYFLFLLNGNK